MVAHTFNPATQEVEAGGSGVQVYPWLFKVNLGYMRPCFQKVRILAVGRMLADYAQSLEFNPQRSTMRVWRCRPAIGALRGQSLSSRVSPSGGTAKASDYLLE